jgi:tryptophan 2,3-dioxygenase
MSEKKVTEYERYIRTGELLNLQKTELSCHDELAFQIVHQVEELWMKLALHELAFAAKQIDGGLLEAGRVAVHRMYLLVELMGTQLRILETMSPRAYFTVRAQLGRGSGQESPRLQPDHRARRRPAAGPQPAPAQPRGGSP